ncbi:CAAX prenyl protease 1 [Populus alba x Populus x berolinensis]|uniref:CAAX prenyl protease 1 n=1 Tax=Populus alba x Populus x berolinensis TaxID=444605 RepID=A0AAD6L9X4_9ROSI|nr:CAAX prenyl protease 1 [Populus alba x Populus x berolinensis]
MDKILTFLQFEGYTLMRNSTDLFRSFGFDTQPVLIGLIIFQHTVIPLQHLVSFGLNLVSRSFEFQADFLLKSLVMALLFGVVL